MAPAYAVPAMLRDAGITLQDFDYYEIHEAFAAQVLCTLKAWESADYCRHVARPAGAAGQHRPQPSSTSRAAASRWGTPSPPPARASSATLAKLLAARRQRQARPGVGVHRRGHGRDGHHRALRARARSADSSSTSARCSAVMRSRGVTRAPRSAWRQGRDSSSSYCATHRASSCCTRTRLARNCASTCCAETCCAGILEPAVIVGRQRDRAVADLRLEREEGLRHVGHADQVGPGAAQEQALGTRAEARPLDAGVGLFLVQRARPRRAPRRAMQRGGGARSWAARWRRAPPGPPPKKLAARRPLVKSRYCEGSAKIARAYFLAQAAHRRDPDQRRTPRLFRAQMLARKLISLGQQLVAQAVAGEEGHLAAVQRAAHQRRGGRAKGRGDLLGAAARAARASHTGPCRR